MHRYDDKKKLKDKNYINIQICFTCLCFSLVISFFHPAKPAQLIISNFCCLDRQHKSINNTYISLLIYCSCVDLFSCFFCIHLSIRFLSSPLPLPLLKIANLLLGEIYRPTYNSINSCLSFILFFIGPKRKKKYLL